MLKKVVLGVLIGALASIATAGSVPAGGSTYKITLLQPSVINGTELKAGDYKFNVTDEKLTIVTSKQNIEVPVKVEDVSEKYDHTAIRYTIQSGKSVISEIRVGGTKTKLVFNP